VNTEDTSVPGRPGLVDSHCHLDYPDFADRMDEVLAEMRRNGVTHAMCISVNLEGAPQVVRLAESHDNLYATVGVHPDQEERPDDVSEAQLLELAAHPRVLAIGETGLDYFRLTGDLVIHTRESAADTLRLMREEGAAEVGGVLHCFTETQETAEAAMEMGFYISFSGIVTFKNAQALKEVAKRVPLDRMLVETDSPYLAPVPFRGKTNQPALVRYVAEEVARLRGVPVDEIAEATTRNFIRLFKPPGLSYT
jgi:TatD DNase family protein